jgi:hypothetical protein
MKMRDVTRTREVATVLAIAIVTTVVALVKASGADLVATILAGLGSGTAICYIVLTNVAIRRARQGERAIRYRRTGPAGRFAEVVGPGMPCALAAIGPTRRLRGPQGSVGSSADVS